jgi:hypothetical protein
MEQQQLQVLAQQFIDALHHLEQHNVDDVDVVVRLFSDDARVSSAALRLTGDERRGRSGVQQFWIEYRGTFDDVASDFSHVLLGDRAAGLVWTTRGNYAGGGPFAYDGVSLLVFDDAGKIAEFRSYYDTRQLSREVTATSAAASDRRG